jgi:hypothetical protein
MDVETSTKGSGCLKHHKFLIFDGKQHPKKNWFRGMLKSPLTFVLKNKLIRVFCIMLKK